LAWIVRLPRQAALTDQAIVIVGSLKNNGPLLSGFWDRRRLTGNSEFGLG
jgi:hypothetical protein